MQLVLVKFIFYLLKLDTTILESYLNLEKALTKRIELMSI